MPQIVPFVVTAITAVTSAVVAAGPLAVAAFNAANIIGAAALASDGKYAFAFGQADAPPPAPALQPADNTVSPPLPGDWTITPRPPAPGGGQLPVIDLSGIVSNATADAMLINWREVLAGEDPDAQPPFMDEEGELLPGWVDAGVWPPTTRTLSIQGPQPGAQIWIAIRYKRGNNVSPAELAGPITVGDLIAGDITPTAPTIVGIRNDIEAAFGDIFDVSELVGQTRQAVEDLQEVYGDTVSAATSAAAAAASEAATNLAKADAIIAKGEAQTARDTAATKATEAAGSAAASAGSATAADNARAAAVIAKGEAQGAASGAAADALVAAQKAGEALGSANSAAGSATTATTKAGEAGTAAAAALASSVTATTAKDAAVSAAVVTMPDGIRADTLYSGSATGNPNTRPNLSGVVNGVLTSGIGVNSTTFFKAAVPWKPGEIYEVTIEVEGVAGTTAPIASPYALRLKSDYGAASSTSPWEFYNWVNTPAGQTVRSTLRFGLDVLPSGGNGIKITANSDAAFVRFGALFNYGSAADRQSRLKFLSIRNVTTQLAAASSATAAATSAASAAASETAAGQSASAADTSRQQAQTARAGAEAAQSSAADSATTATGAAATATQQAGLATSAKNASETAAQASVDARDQAASFADDAEVSANASSAASVTAVAARQAAEAAQGGSEDARDQSQSAATAAAGSASTAATKATEAGNSATAANAAKVAAESARDTADSRATAAAQSASAAATSSTQAGQSASAAQTAKTDAETARAQAQTFRNEAADSATNAAGSAASASSAASQSVTAKDQAQGFANAANTSAQNAAGSATAAGNSASAANTSKTAAEAAYSSAVSAAVALMPDVIAADLLTSGGGAGAPASKPNLPSAQVANGAFTSLVGTPAQAYFKAVVPWKVGEIYEVTIDVEGLAGSVAPIASPYALRLNSSYSSADTAFEYYIFGNTPVGQTTRRVIRFGLDVTPPTPSGIQGMKVFASASAAFVRFGALFNYGSATDRQARLKLLTIRNVTAQVAAETSATASATSAANAAASATLAGEKASAAQTSATAADTSRGQAQTAATQASQSETNAAGSAASASSAAQNAATSRDQASGFATAASGSASTASTKANEAGNSAAAAAASQVSATAAKDAAVSAKDGAETARGQAQSSATAAATSASSASASATTAGEKAASASGSAVTAATKAGEALSYAYDAATSAANAQGAAESIATSIEGLEARTANTEADIIDLENALANETAARAEAIQQVTARLATRRNEVRNATGALGLQYWNGSGFSAGTSFWGPFLFTTANGNQALYSDLFAAAGNGQYTIQVDIEHQAVAGLAGANILWFNGPTALGFSPSISTALNRNFTNAAPLSLTVTAPSNATRGQLRLFVDGHSNGYIAWRRAKVELGPSATGWTDDATTDAIGASVTEQSLAIIDLENQQALAAWQVVAAASGGKPARIGIASSTLGSYVALDAPYIFWGDNTVFDDATDTLQTTVGGRIRVMALGAPFGAGGDLLEWWGPSGIDLGAMTTANGHNGRMTTAPYVFDNSPAIVPFRIVSSHASVGATRSGAGVATTALVTFGVEGATGPVRFDVYFVDGDNTVTATNTSSSSASAPFEHKTSFRATLAIGQQKTARFVCAVRDALGNSGAAYVAAGLTETT